MKKLLLLFCFMLLLLKVNAQDLIAVDFNGTSSFYTNLDTALAKAPAGAVVYLPGTTFSKSGGGSYTISNQISLIGAGHYTDSTSATGKTVIANLINIYAGGCFFTGIEFQGQIDNYASNLLITRSNFDGTFFCISTSASTINFQECVFNNFTGTESSGATYNQNISFNNCIITGQIDYILSGLTIDNCILLLNGNYNSLNDVHDVVVSNSIIMNSTIVAFINGNSNSTVNNCVFQLTDSVYVGATTQYSNKFGVVGSQIFVNQSGTAFSYVQNYHIKSGSVALTAGVGSTQCGIYGGANPYKEGAVPLNPHIQLANISNSTNQSGNLQVNIKVASQTR